MATCSNPERSNAWRIGSTAPPAMPLGQKKHYLLLAHDSQPAAQEALGFYHYEDQSMDAKGCFSPVSLLIKRGRTRFRRFNSVSRIRSLIAEFWSKRLKGRDGKAALILNLHRSFFFSKLCFILKVIRCFKQDHHIRPFSSVNKRKASCEK